MKPDRRSVQGGAAPLTVGHELEVDPYPTGTVEEGFPDHWCAALSHCMERFEGCRDKYVQVRSGGAGAFTADNFPVFDRMLDNVYVAADSNHGYKMIAVGREIARVLQGEHSTLLAALPLRALRHGRPASRLAEPLPVELERRTTSGRPTSGRRGRGRSARACPRAWRLAERGADVLVLEKDRIGSGASGTRAGIVRNYYRSPAVTELIRQSVEMFEADPEAYGFRQVGYIAAVPAGQVEDLVAIREQHEAAGYESELVVGAEGCASTSTGPGPTGEAGSRPSCTSAVAAGRTRCRPCATWPSGLATAGPRSPRASR